MPTNIFKGLAWHQVTVYATLLLTSLLLPINWHYACWSMVVGGVAVVVGLFAQHRVGNPILGRDGRVAYYLMILFVLALLPSVLRSENKAYAWSVMGTQSVLMVLPLMFLLYDFSWLKRHHVKTIFAASTIVVLIRFLIFFSIAIVKIFNGQHLTHLLSHHFDPLHHNYLSLYILGSMAFLYSELILKRSERLFGLHRWIHIVVIVMLGAYELLCCSRSGFVAMLLMIVAAAIHLVIIMKRWRWSVVFFVLTTLTLVCIYITLPEVLREVVDTTNALLNGERGDIRQDMFRCARLLIAEEPIFGYPVGDYLPLLFQSYYDNGVFQAFEYKYGPHNQYHTSLLTMGIVGLLAQLAMMITPIVVAIRRHSARALTVFFTIAYATLIFFESMFDRAMGGIYIALNLCLLIISTQMVKEQE